MTKSDKKLGITKPADLKHIDVELKIKGKHKKKQYPPHWQIRSFGFYPSKALRSSTEWHYDIVLHNGYKCYTSSAAWTNVNGLLDSGQLDRALEIMSYHHPETANWPVRFINVQPMVTVREVL